VTAIVVSFPKERIYRTRQDQIEMRKACQYMRRKNPKMAPRDVWDGAATAMAIKDNWEKMRTRAANPTPLDERVSQLAARLLKVMAPAEMPPDGAA
jgi:hypothetical protein